MQGRQRNLCARNLTAPGWDGAQGHLRRPCRSVRCCSHLGSRDLSTFTPGASLRRARRMARATPGVSCHLRQRAPGGWSSQRHAMPGQSPCFSPVALSSARALLALCRMCTHQRSGTKHIPQTNRGQGCTTAASRGPTPAGRFRRKTPPPTRTGHAARNARRACTWQRSKGGSWGGASAPTRCTTMQVEARGASPRCRRREWGHAPTRARVARAVSPSATLCCVLSQRPPQSSLAGSLT